MLLNALTIFGSLLVALLIRFEDSVPMMYWGSFLLLVALSVVLFLVGLNYRGGTIFAAVALILINFATGLVPNSVIIMGATLSFVLLTMIDFHRRRIIPRTQV